MIVFPHVPKTGGSSIRSALQQRLGPRLLLDYDHSPMRVEGARPAPLASDEAMALAGDYDMVYGHFAADRYQALNGRVAMFFRNPRDRVLSHYHYQQAKGRMESVSLADFLQRPNQMAVYSRFLGCVPISDLAFVGITEAFSDSLRLFRAVFGIDLDERRERVGSWELPEDLNDAIALSQRDNWTIYDQARRRFDELCRAHF